MNYQNSFRPFTAVVILLAAAASSRADVPPTFLLSPVSDAFASIPGSLFPTSPANIVGGQPGTEYRSALEFQLPALPPHPVIISAKLDLHIAAESSNGGGFMGIYAHSYVGDGIVSLSDMQVNNPVAGPFNIGFLSNPDPVEFDVTSAVQTLYNSGAIYSGFTLRAVGTLFVLQLGSQDNGIAASRPTLALTVPEPAAAVLAICGLLICCSASLLKLPR